VLGSGLVTSGTYSPSLRIGIGLAYLPVERADPGTPFEIDVRGRSRPAVVAQKPLYEPDAK
jgi:aminomethyltransferase